MPLQKDTKGNPNTDKYSKVPLVPTVIWSSVHQRRGNRIQEDIKEASLTPTIIIHSIYSLYIYNLYNVSYNVEHRGTKRSVFSTFKGLQQAGVFT